jgi:hypothetical protein
MSFSRFALLPLVVFAAACSSSSSEQGSSPPPGNNAPPATTQPADPPVPPACPDGDAWKDEAGKVVVKASVNGGAVRSWVLDTGAPISVADNSIAAEVTGKDVSITVGGITKAVGRNMIVDDVRGNMRMDVAGILGHDVFGDVLTLDYPRKRFWITTEIGDANLRACTHVRGAPALVDAKVEDYVYVKGSAETTPGWFLVDSGASLGAMPFGVFDTLQKANPRAALDGFYTPAAIGTFWAQLTSIGYLDVGGLRVENILTRTLDDDLIAAPKSLGSDRLLGVLPSGYLRHFMVTIDFPKQKVRLDAAKDDALKQPTGFYPVGIGIKPGSTQPPVIISHVLPGSSAAEAGIVAGDELVAIDGTQVATLDPYARPFRLLAAKTGIEIVVTVKHEGTTATHDLVTRDLLTPPKL